jgi:hypothetical protein
VNTPAVCTECETPIGLMPTQDGLARNLEAWVNYECRYGAQVGAKAAYAKMAARALECAIVVAWNDWCYTQPEAEAIRNSRGVRWDLAIEAVERRCDVGLYALADGSSAVAPLADPPSNWVAYVHLRTALSVEGGSAELQPEMEEAFKYTFRGAEIVGDGAAIIKIPRNTSTRLVYLDQEGSPLTREARLALPEPTLLEPHWCTEILEVFDAPPDPAQVFGLQPPPEPAPIISLQEHTQHRAALRLG